jgi:hypothetical protein
VSSSLPHKALATIYRTVHTIVRRGDFQQIAATLIPC